MSELDKIRKRIARRESLKKEEPESKFNLGIGKDINRIDAFGQDIAPTRPQKTGVDFSQTIETLKLPGETGLKGIQQIQEGDALTGALNVALGIGHSMFLPFSLPFSAATDVVESTGRVAGIEGVTEPLARAINLPFELPGRLVEEGQKQIDAGLQSLGVDTKQTDQAIMFELKRRGLVSQNATPEELRDVMSEINKLGATVLALKVAHMGIVKSKGGKTIKEPTPKVVKGELTFGEGKRFVKTKDLEKLRAPKVDIKGEAVELKKMLDSERVIPEGFERVKPLAEKQLEPKFEEVRSTTKKIKEPIITEVKTKKGVRYKNEFGKFVAKPKKKPQTKVKKPTIIDEVKDAKIKDEKASGLPTEQKLAIKPKTKKEVEKRVTQQESKSKEVGGEKRVSETTGINYKKDLLPILEKELKELEPIRSKLLRNTEDITKLSPEERAKFHSIDYYAQVRADIRWIKDNRPNIIDNYGGVNSIALKTRGQFF